MVPHYYSINPIRASKIIGLLRWRMAQGMEMANKAVARETGIPEAAIRAAKRFFHWGDTMKWPIARIRRDGGMQSRSSIPAEWVKRYAEDMERGDIFPPVDVFHDGEHYWLANGYIRTGAAESLGLTEIEIKVHQGTKRDAQLFSFQANHDNGNPRTDADIDRAVEAMLTDPEWSKWSNREIARRCHTSEHRIRLAKKRVKDLHCDPVAVQKPDAVTYINGNGQECTMVKNDADLDDRIQSMLCDPLHEHLNDRQIADACGTNLHKVRRIRKRLEDQANEATDKPSVVKPPKWEQAANVHVPTVTETVPSEPIDIFEPAPDAWAQEMAAECEATSELHEDCRDSLRDEIAFFNVVASQIKALGRQAEIALTQYRPHGTDIRPAGPYASLVIALLKASNPNRWRACKACKNSVGLAKGFAMNHVCKSCNGFGFTLAN